MFTSTSRKILKDPPQIKYKYLTNKSDIIKAIAKAKRLPFPSALDLETTDLTPKGGEVSLLQLSYDEDKAIVCDLLKARLTMADLKPQLQHGEWAVFNNKFEGLWFSDAGIDADLIDVGMMRRAVMGGDHVGLASHVAWDQGIDMDKDEQVSDWGLRPLSKSQLSYAALDAVLTFRQYRHWESRMSQRHWHGFRYINELWRPVIEMETAGMRLNRQGHAALVTDWQEKMDAALMIMQRTYPIDNYNSRHQLTKFFTELLDGNAILRVWPKTEKQGLLSFRSADIERLMAAFRGDLREFFSAYLDYAHYFKLLSSFGDSLIDKCELGGIIKAEYRAARAITTRFSCAGPNLQQIPKSKLVRGSFIARPDLVLVCADYASIEVRTLAELSGDEKLRHDCIYGDPHAEVAAMITGHPVERYAGDRTEEADKERSAAKATTFGILYGSSAVGLAGRLRVSMEEAEGYIEGWAARYPTAWDYRNKVMRQANDTGYIELPSGRSIYMGRNPSPTKCANYPVQSTAADVVHKALITLHDIKKTKTLSKWARVLSVIHDEIVCECKPSEAGDVQQLLEWCMVDGWLSVFPGSDTTGLVEPGTGLTWAEAKG